MISSASVLVQQAMALPTFPNVVTRTYLLKPSGIVAAANQDCSLCHVPPGPPKLNPYGMDVKGVLAAAHTKDLTPAILHSIDSKDSDGDGASNGAEIAADRLPGDPSSKPGGATAQTIASAPRARSDEDNSLLPILLKLAFPKHAHHPVLVHFPIGLFVMSVIFDLIAIRKNNRSLSLAGYYNLVAAGITASMAVVSGLLAWWFAFGHEALDTDRFLLFHLVLGSVTTLLILGLCLLRSRTADKGAKPSTLYAAVALIAFVLISITGHLGGNLTGVN